MLLQRRPLNTTLLASRNLTTVARARDVSWRTSLSTTPTPTKLQSPVFNGRRYWHEDYAAIQKERDRRFRAALGVFMLAFIPLTCLGLGIWQIRRLRWKEELIEDLADKLQRAPIGLPRNVNISELQNFEYRKVHLVGVWDHAHTILIGPKSRDNTKGYHIITPLFRPNNSSTILVNRGFVSADIVKAHPEWLAQERGEVQVMGLLRSSQEKNTFTPENNPEKGEWYWVDVEAIAERAGGLEYGVQPVYIESTFDGNTGEAASMLAHGVPIGRSSNIELRNMHTTYAVTWFSLAAVTAILWYRLAITRARLIPITGRVERPKYTDVARGPFLANVSQASAKGIPLAKPAFDKPERPCPHSLDDLSWAPNAGSPPKPESPPEPPAVPSTPPNGAATPGPDSKSSGSQ